ncbi:MAG: O-antigen ligase family protein [Candidatus Spechtbacterales bacterium]
MGRKVKRKKQRETSTPEKKPVSHDTGFALFLIEIIRWGAYIALFAPLVVHSGFFFPFVVPKTVFFWILAEIIFAAWLLLAISNKQFRPRWNAVSITLGVFLLITVVTSFTGINVERSFWSTLERMAGTINWIHLALFFFALTFTFRTLADWKKLLTASLIAASLVALIFLFQKIGISVIPFDTRSGATIGNSSFMAAYLLFNIFFGTWLFGSTGLGTKKILYGVGTVLVIFAVLFGIAYGALLSMLGGLFVILLAWFFFGIKTKLARSFGALLLLFGTVIGSIVIWGTFTQSEAVIGKLPYFFSDNGTIGARKVVWNMAWQGVKERPILGWGPENFNVVFTKYFNPCLTLPKCGNEVWYDRTHNIILDNLIHSGFVGLFAYLAIFAVSLFAAVRWALRDKTKWLLSGVITAALASYFVQNMLVFDMMNTYLMFALTLALVGGMSRVFSNEEKRELKSPNIRLATMVGAVLIYFLFSFGVQSLQAASWGVKISRGGLSAEETIKIYKKSLSATPLSNRQIVEFFTTRVTDTIKNDKDQKVPLDFIYEVEKVMRESAEKNPLDFRHQIILGDLYVSARDRDPEFLARGEKIFKHAIEMAPTNQQGYTLLSQTYIFKKEYEKAEPLLFRAIELEPKYMRSHVALANLYELWGKKEKAEEAYKKVEELGYKRK